MLKHKIKKVNGRMVFDSRGLPTVEAEIYLNNGIITRAIAPSGASRGKNEAIEKRDKKKNFLGFSVYKNIYDIKNKINDAFVGQSVLDQKKLDNILLEIDGTRNKRTLGSNTTTAISMATIKAAASFKKQSLWEHLNSKKKNLKLPLPQVQIFGGGAHADNQISIQDFLIIPNGARNFIEAMEWVFIIFRNTHEELKKKNLLKGFADEGGYWPCFKKNEDVLIFLSKIIERSGFKLLKEVSIALDIAANNFYYNSLYYLNKKSILSAELLLDTYNKWLKQYPIISLEDPFSENDILYFKKLMNDAPEYVQIVGDDLVVTNTRLISKAVNNKSINSLLIKPNQIGTISETLDALNLSRDLGLVEVISARSGETEDVTIADLSIGWQTNQIKVGSFSRSERLAKWNQCLRIGEQIENDFLMQKNTVLKWDRL
ncbi:phosphopyruvate hydratase [Alphaproteobacteria bacterium]|nr:phosphopyruvate hydratase [Alphaproteobacteria bacterium]